MSFRHPPGVALWLLEHAWIGNYGDALAGDLIEHYQSGRSRWWFWRQVGYALVIAIIPSSLLRKLLAAFGLVTLGFGTLAWASVEKHGLHETPVCAQTIRNAGESAECARSDLP